MRIRSNIWPCRRVLAAALAFAGVMGAVRAEPILFTRAAVPIVVPPREPDPLPKLRGEELDFSDPVQQPFVIRPQIIQRQPIVSRDVDDEEKDLHPLLRDPFKVQDPLGKDPLRASSNAVNRNPLRLPWQTAKTEKKDEPKSLHPVASLDWRARDPRDARDARDPRDSRFLDRQWPPRDGRPDRERERDLSNPRPTTPQPQDILEAPLFIDPQVVRAREKARTELEERRMAFQQLLNPRPAASTRPPGSLEPVTALDALGLDKPDAAAPKPAAPAPIAARSESLYPRGPLDPTKSFQERQARLGSLEMEDPGKKFAPPPKPEAAKPPSTFQTPLLYQPIQREIPSRHF